MLKSIEWIKRVADEQIAMGPENGSLKMIYFCANFLMFAYPDPAAISLVL